MAYSQNQDRRRDWENWVEKHRQKLLKCRLPPILLEDQSAWGYFLEHGDLPDGFGIWSGWNVSMLSPGEAKHFHEFLTKEAAETDQPVDMFILSELQKAAKQVKPDRS